MPVCLPSLLAKPENIAAVKSNLHEVQLLALTLAVTLGRLFTVPYVTW